MDFYFKLILTLLNVFYVGAQAEALNGVTKISSPYSDYLDGKHEGYAIDVLIEISKIVGFGYQLHFSPDGGVDGLVDEVHSKRADFAISAIPVTDNRKLLVDFTEPILDTGIAIILSKDMAKTIKSFKDLTRAMGVYYGTNPSGAAYELISSSTDPTIVEIYIKMNKNPNVLVNDTREGLLYTFGTEFALITDTFVAEHLTRNECNLTYIVDNSYDFSIQYAIALPKDSKFTESFNSAIRELKQKGRLAELKNKYCWSDRCERVESEGQKFHAMTDWFTHLTKFLGSGSGNETNVSSHQSYESDHQTEGLGHESYESGNESKVSVHESNVSSDEFFDSGHESKILGPEYNISGHESNISGHESNISGHESNISGHESNISGHESNISAHEFSGSVHELETTNFDSNNSDVENNVLGHEHNIPGNDYLVHKKGEPSASYNFANDNIYKIILILSFSSRLFVCNK